MYIKYKMLGTGVKNAILFLLIVLILHFLIKNALIERFTCNNNKQESYPQPNLQLKQFRAVDEDDVVCKGTTSLNAVCAPNKQDTELRNFVFDDDHEDLAKYFKGFDVTSEVSAEIDKKKACIGMRRSDSGLLPESTTCDPGFDGGISTNLLEAGLNSDSDMASLGGLGAFGGFEPEYDEYIGSGNCKRI